MEKFLVLYRATGAPMTEMPSATPEERDAEMQKWTAWGASIGDALVEWGAPLGASETIHGAAGPGRVEGYSIVQARTLEAARGLFDGHPHLAFPGNTIQLSRVLPMPGA